MVARRSGALDGLSARGLLRRAGAGGVLSREATLLRSLRELRRAGPEMAIGESVTRAGLEVTFEVAGQLQGVECDVELDLPRPVLGSVLTLAAIVLGKPRSQIGRVTDVAFAGILDALQDVRVEHIKSLEAIGTGLPTLAARATEGTILRALTGAPDGPPSVAPVRARRMVEAAGIEPASEKACTKASTRLARSFFYLAVRSLSGK